MDPVSGDAGLEASAIELSSGSIRKRQHGEISHDDEENAPSSKELRQMGQEGEEPPPDEVEGRGEAPVDFLIIGAQKAGTMAAVKNINK